MLRAGFLGEYAAASEQGCKNLLQRLAVALRHKQSALEII